MFTGVDLLRRRLLEVLDCLSVLFSRRFGCFHWFGRFFSQPFLVPCLVASPLEKEKFAIVGRRPQQILDVNIGAICSVLGRLRTAPCQPSSSSAAGLRPCSRDLVSGRRCRFEAH